MPLQAAENNCSHYKAPTEQAAPTQPQQYSRNVEAQIAFALSADQLTLVLPTILKRTTSIA